MKKLIILIFGIFLLSGLVVAADFAPSPSSDFGKSTSASFVNYQTRQQSFQTYYTADQIGTYWPTLNDKETCEGRQDILLQIAPAGCQPAVVRSDLLADQNVPVFCQIDSLKINPLLDVKAIKNIRFSGSYPKEVISTGYHPALAAIRTRDKLLGSPLINNIGYVVVVLKKTGNESQLPDFVRLNLIAQLEYESGNAFGVGAAEFILSPLSDDAWNDAKYKQSFLNGKYSLRLNEVDANTASVSIYSGDREINKISLQRGKASKDIYLPGSYCQAAITLDYNGFEAAKNKATIEISSDSGADVYDVYMGQRIADGKCTVGQIIPSENGNDMGSVVLTCGSNKATLSLKDKGGSLYGKAFVDGNGLFAKPDLKTGKYIINLGSKTFGLDKGTGYYGLNEKDEFVMFATADATGESIINTDSVTGKDTAEREKNKQDLISLRDALIEYKKSGATAVKGISDASGTSDALNVEQSYGVEGDKRFGDTISELEGIADDYRAESVSNTDKTRYGEMALYQAIELAKNYNKQQTLDRLRQKFMEYYPDSEIYPIAKARNDLAISKVTDMSNAGMNVETANGRIKTIRLVSVSKPAEKAKASFTWAGISVKDLELGSVREGLAGGNKLTLVRIDDSEHVSVSASCAARMGVKAAATQTESLVLGESKQVCGVPLILDDVNTEYVARIKINPKVKNTKSETNLSVVIGIEKRAIQLSPEKTIERIDTLNKSIQDWEKISKTLANVVTGLKGACFATAGVLTIKNFFTGLSGEATARQRVMRGQNGWVTRCKDEIARTGKSLDSCYLDHSTEIDKDVELEKSQINKMDNALKVIENKNIASTSMFGNTIDTEKAKLALAEKMKKDFAGTKINEVPINDYLSDKNVNDAMSYEDMRELYMQLDTDKYGESLGYSSTRRNSSRDSMKDLTKRIDTNIEWAKQAEEDKKLRDTGLPNPVQGNGDVAFRRIAQVVSKDSLTKNYGNVVSQFVDPNINYVMTVRSPGYPANDRDGAAVESGLYMVGVIKNNDGTYSPREVIKMDGNKGVLLDKTQADNFNSRNKIGIITSGDNINYNHKYNNPVIRFYETAPYKGMPAIVPIDANAGWYAATKPTLPSFGRQGAFDSSGRVTSFELCNVGENGNAEANEGYGDDICERINTNTGMPTNIFPGLSEEAAKSLVKRAINAMDKAAQGYGNKNIQIESGRTFTVDKPAALVPSASCSEFMSAVECQLLFNVCDPVICPASRCDLGGLYPVQDVIQTGMVGGALLCLPNFKDKIMIPVCLTGIQAGIDSYVSIMKAHRDCLQKNLETGEMIGFCDQVYSIYLCEFFWRQIGPIANKLLPAIVAGAYGQGTKGGGEYLTTMGAWQNTQKSIDYFTQTYAVNSLKAFQAKSVEEVGSSFCKVFISAKGPSSLKSLIEPESPPQFYATFSSIPYSTATVPATAQYKVYYHIYAGKDVGVYYNVYLKTPPDSSYYYSTPTIQMASGFIAKGEYASETLDKTLPEGYKELCVKINDEEKCGFKEVTTDFGLNYLRDSYAQEELTQKDITTSKECISGSPSASALLANSNPQSAIEEATMPQAYNRGIIRICSTQNPGSSTDPSRFVEKGYCDTPKMKCWLDMTSIKKAITDENQGIKNETYKELEQTIYSSLSQNSQILTGDEANAELNSIKTGVEKVNVADTKSVDELYTRMDYIKPHLVLDNHKAILAYEKAKLMVKVLLNKLPSVVSKVIAKDAAGSISVDGTTSSTQTKIPGISLSKKYDRKIEVLILNDGKPTGLVMKNGIVYLGDKRVGVVKEGSNIIDITDKIQVENLVGKDGLTALQGKDADEMNYVGQYVNLDTSGTEEVSVSPVKVSEDGTGTEEIPADSKSTTVLSTDINIASEEISSKILGKSAGGGIEFYSLYVNGDIKDSIWGAKFFNANPNLFYILIGSRDNVEGALQVGVVEGDVIRLYANKKSDVEKALGEGRYSALNGQKISDLIARGK